MSDEAPKSSYELAMERLRKQDEEAGVRQVPLTGEQKAGIAEVRSLYESKLAQQDILHSSALLKTFDPLEREKLDEEHRRERARLNDERDRAIERIRTGQA